jgi:hypothetical protein
MDDKARIGDEGKSGSHLNHSSDRRYRSGCHPISPRLEFTDSEQPNAANSIHYLQKGWRPFRAARPDVGLY